MEYPPLWTDGHGTEYHRLGGAVGPATRGINGHPPPEEKRRIYLRAAELGVNLFDMGYGDEVHIPDELKGQRDDRFFSLKVGAPAAAEVEGTIEQTPRQCAPRSHRYFAGTPLCLSAKRGAWPSASPSARPKAKCAPCA